jgi:hypothetical protein
MAEFTTEDQALFDKNLTHGLIFPDKFKDRIRDAILAGLRNVNYKNVPGIGAVRGKKLVQWSGTYGDFNFNTGGYVSIAASAPIAKTAQIFSGIADGKYLIFYDSQISGTDVWLGLSINGDTPVDADSLGCRGVSQTFARCLFRTLKNSDNNTIEVMCKNLGAGTVFLDYLQITLIKIADQ